MAYTERVGLSDLFWYDVALDPIQAGSTAIDVWLAYPDITYGSDVLVGLVVGTVDADPSDTSFNPGFDGVDNLLKLAGDGQHGIVSLAVYENMALWMTVDQARRTRPSFGNTVEKLWM